MASGLNRRCRVITQRAFTALKEDGSVVAGNPEWGGDTSGVNEEHRRLWNIATDAAFVALKRMAL